MTTTEGIDVSMWQDTIDWQEVKRAGKKFAIIKATEGTYGTDPQFSRNWAQCLQYDIPRCSYHFLRSNEDGARQAAFHHAYVRAHGRFKPGDACMLDHETADGVSASQMTACAEAFVSEILRSTQCGVLYYVGYYFYQDAMGAPHSHILGRCPLVEPSYGAGPLHIPQWPNGPTIWQYSETGRVPGISTACDLDRAYCDLPTLKKLFRMGGRE